MKLDPESAAALARAEARGAVRSVVGRCQTFKRPRDTTQSDLEAAALARAEARGGPRWCVGRVQVFKPPATAADLSDPREHAQLFRQGGVELLRVAGPVTHLTAGAGDAAGLPSTFAGVAYSGGYVPDYELVIDMDSTTYKPRMPLLNAHQRSEIIGVVEQAATRNGQMHVAGRLFSDMPDSVAERIAKLAQRGVPFEMSVGIYSFRRDPVPAGKSVNVNGRTISGPVNVLRHGQVREVSLVTLGADPNTHSRFA